MTIEILENYVTYTHHGNFQPVNCVHRSWKDDTAAGGSPLIEVLLDRCSGNRRIGAREKHRVTDIENEQFTENERTWSVVAVALAKGAARSVGTRR